MQRIYLDHNATTPILPEVFAAMTPYLQGAFGNPSSAHSYGADARFAIEQARENVADLVGASPEGVLFTSSATEAINTAIRTLPVVHRRSRIVLTSVEHVAVLECAATLQSAQYDVVSVPVDRLGQIDLEYLEKQVTSDTALVCAMWANNETGVVFPVADVARICGERGVPLFVDAVQAAGKLSMSMDELGVDLLAISAHKLFGPKGVGALVALNPGLLHPLLVGGQQEEGRRAGTENVPGVVGFGEAAKLAKIQLGERRVIATSLRDRLESAILRRIPNSYVNGAPSHRVGNTSNIGFEGVDSDTVVALLDAAGVCVSTGSACHSASMTPSHVLLAMTGSHIRAREAVRFSLSQLNTEDEIDRASDAVARAVDLVRTKAIPA